MMMDIRDFRKKKVSKRKFGVALILVILLIIAFYKIKNYFNAPSTQDVWTGELYSGQQTASYARGDRITFAGTLTVDNNFPLYTHTIIKGTEKISVKSTSINLNNYLGAVEVVGAIEDIYKGVAIVDVDVIKLAKPGLIIKGNAYLFIKDLLYFDFMEQPQLSANKSGKNISVYFNAAPILDVERFLCSKIVKDKDCNSIMEGYLRDQKEFFTSYRGYSFYKHGDKTRALFDGNIFGYMFKNVEDDTLLDISNMIKIVNQDFVMKNKKDIMIDVCKNAQDAAKTANATKIGFSDPYFLTITVEGQTQGQKNYSCVVTFDLWNEWNPSNVEFIGP